MLLLTALVILALTDKLDTGEAEGCGWLLCSLTELVIELLMLQHHL